MKVGFPGPENRTLVVGRTGSGKTTFAEWLLTGVSFDAMPWVIMNTKDDPSIKRIAQIEGVKQISVHDMPGERGLYICNVAPDELPDADKMLAAVWEKTNCGLFIDEVYMFKSGRDAGLNRCLTQGRTRRIPMIICSQRPAWCSMFVFSESEYISVFNLQRLQDRKKIAEIVPVDPNYRLAKHCSYWYNVPDDQLVQFAPVPNTNEIIENFRAKFPPNGAPAPRALEAPQQSLTRRRVV